jgi:hypothetical protein
MEWMHVRTGGSSADTTLRVAKLAALFCSLMAAAYAALQIQPSPVMGLLLTSAPAVVWIVGPQGGSSVTIGGRRGKK